MILALFGALALVVAYLLIERQARRHDQLVTRLVSSVIDERTAFQEERQELLNRIAHPEILHFPRPLEGDVEEVPEPAGWGLVGTSDYTTPDLHLINGGAEA